MTITSTSPKITPFLWFDTEAEEAMNFYVSIFDNAKVIGVTRYGKTGPGPEGSVMTASFELDGQRFVALNGGPHYTFTPAVSFAVRCETQAEVDRLWDQLLEGGGKPNRCGWLQDKYGLSWQIVPEALPRLLQDPNRTKASAVMQAMLKMTKIDIAALQQAYDAA
jgi:predicted 3-demethylubiquinone-9 3-methyltransferase (glyoxalase superfamily)